MTGVTRARWAIRLVAVALGLLVTRVATPWVAGRWAGRWLDGDAAMQLALAEELIAFEADDDAARATPATERFAGEWALVTHQMTALGLAQIALAHPEQRARLAPEVTRAALKSWRAEMRGFGTRAWGGEDALASTGSTHGHAYFAYPALAVGVARWLDPAFPAATAREHDAVIAAYERRLLASPTGLIETYPGESYPTDCAAVAAAIAVHGRATGADHSAVLARWARHVVDTQLDTQTGFVVQRMGWLDAKAHDAPRGSGTALGAYFAGFADRAVARKMTEALVAHESSFFGFAAIDEYGRGRRGAGDVDSGPVVLGVSVTATGCALGPLRAHGFRADFERVYRTTQLFGVPWRDSDRVRFVTGGPIGNAMLLAMLTSGPELAP